MQKEIRIILHCKRLTPVIWSNDMTSFEENFEKLSALQKQGLEPIRDFTVFAVDAFEKLARKKD